MGDPARTGGRDGADLTWLEREDRPPRAHAPGHASGDDARRRSLNDPEGFWAEQAALVSWIHPPRDVLDRSRAPSFSWFPDGTLNTCFNALDRHIVAGLADRTALILDSPATGVVRRFTYAELLSDVAAFAGALRGLGVTLGERVMVHLPTIPEAVVAMLACARIGAVHAAVLPGLTASELALRIDNARPRAVLSASVGFEPSGMVEYKPILDRALELATHAPEVCVIKQRPLVRAAMAQGRDVDWDLAMQAGRADPAACVEVAATAPLDVLYPSGSTGRPRGIVRDNGGHAVAMAQLLPNVFGVGPGQVWFAASSLGGVVGHSCIVYAPLITGATTILFEGNPVGAPDAGALWRVVHEHQVGGMLAAPRAIRAARAADPDGRLLGIYDTSSLEGLFLAGDGLDDGTRIWATECLGVPVVDTWGHTETGWPIAADRRGPDPATLMTGLPPLPGYDVRILGEHGQEVPTGTVGAICLGLPLPPGALSAPWGDDERFVRSHVSASGGHYLTGERGYVDEAGCLFVSGRTDAGLDVLGHRAPGPR